MLSQFEQLRRDEDNTGRNCFSTRGLFVPWMYANVEVARQGQTKLKRERERERDESEQNKRKKGEEK